MTRFLFAVILTTFALTAVARAQLITPISGGQRSVWAGFQYRVVGFAGCTALQTATDVATDYGLFDAFVHAEQTVVCPCPGCGPDHIASISSTAWQYSNILPASIIADGGASFSINVDVGYALRDLDCLSACPAQCHCLDDSDSCDCCNSSQLRINFEIFEPLRYDFFAQVSTSWSSTDPNEGGLWGCARIQLTDSTPPSGAIVDYHAGLTGIGIHVELSNGILDPGIYTIEVSARAPQTVFVSESLSSDAGIVLDFNVFRLADINADGVSDLTDADLFVQVLLGTDTDPAHVQASDINGDGTTDGADIQGFIDSLLFQP